MSWRSDCIDNYRLKCSIIVKREVNFRSGSLWSSRSHFVHSHCFRRVRKWHHQRNSNPLSFVFMTTVEAWCVCTSYKYIILCERVGVCPKTVICGGLRWVQFAFRPLNKGSDDTPKTYRRIEHVISRLKTGVK